MRPIVCLLKRSGTVAQLVRAPSLYLGGRWFESIPSHHATLRLSRRVLLFVLEVPFDGGERVSEMCYV